MAFWKRSGNELGNEGPFFGNEGGFGNELKTKAFVRF